MVAKQPFVHEPVDLGYTDMIAHTTEEGRVYEHPVERKNYPSITTVLSILSKDKIDSWRKKVGDDQANRISTRASKRGTAVHECVEDYLNNTSSLQLVKKYTPDVLQSLASLKPIFEESIGTILGQELPLYSDHLQVAGRVDCVAYFNGKLSIIDFKTSKRPKPKEWISNYFAQEAAYAIMWEERTQQPITQLVTIIAVDEPQPHAQVYIEHRDNWTQLLRDTIDEYTRSNP